MVPYGTRRPAGEQARDVRTSGTTHGRGFTMTFASPAALGPRARLGVLLKGKPCYLPWPTPAGHTVGAQGSDVAVAHQRVDAAMHAWRAFAADAARRAQHDQLAAIAGPGTALRRQRERLAQGFGTWHEVCVLALPPVMRQLLHARRRMVQAEQAQEADARSRGPARGVLTAALAGSTSSWRMCAGPHVRACHGQARAQGVGVVYGWRHPHIRHQRKKTAGKNQKYGFALTFVIVYALF